MTSVSAWCEMMEQFLNELEKTFPQETNIKKYHASYDLVKKANSRKCVEAFMNGASEYSQQIMQKDESFFLEHGDSIEFLKKMNMKKNWQDPELSQTTRMLFGSICRPYIFWVQLLQTFLLKPLI